jgi:predicted nucleic acid-binding protein
VILVDTSIWIDHLRATDTGLVELLTQNAVVCHDLVIGEIACGNLKKRKQVLSLLSALPQCPSATHAEIRFFIERHRLMGRGIGYVDASLLAAVILGNCRLWTRDKRLAGIAAELGCRK